MAFDPLKRQDEIRTMIQVFNQKTLKHEDFETNEDCCVEIVNIYEEVALPAIRGYLPEGANANIYKVASGLEFGVLACAPIKIEGDEVKSNQYNSLLAASLASSVVWCKQYDEIVFNSHNPELNGRVTEMYEDHLKWLHSVNPESFPIILNSEWWKGFHFILGTERLIPMPY